MAGTPEAGWRHRTRTPVLVLTAAAWVATVELAAMGQGAMPQMAAHRSVAPSGLLLVPMVVSMVAAMMAPLLIEPLRHVLSRSLRQRRLRAVVLLVAAHLAVWVAGGVLLQATAALLVHSLGFRPALGVALAAVVAWHLTPTARRLAQRHHARPPLAAFGAAADTDLLAYAVRHAASCLATCWPVMLVPALGGAQAFAAMAVGSAWVWLLALEPPAPARWGLLWPRRGLRLLLHAPRRLPGSPA